MKILNVTQNTPEWDELRRGKIGASDAPIIMGESPWKDIGQLWDEKVLGNESYKSAAMVRGSELEEEARELLSARNQVEYQPAVVQSDQFEWMIASLDCYHPKAKDHEKILEIKCCGKKTWDEFKKGIIPRHYLWQLQHQMLVTGIHQATLAVYNPDDKTPFLLFMIKGDPEMFEQLIQKESEFYQNMIDYRRPVSKSKTDPVEREDKAWEQKSLRLKKAREALEKAKKEEIEAEEALIAEANGISAKGFGVSVTKYERKGNIDYSLIPELKTVDLESYRKPSTLHWRVGC